jgi:hypothetical protein
VCDQAIALWSIYMMWEIKSRPRSGVDLDEPRVAPATDEKYSDQVPSGTDIAGSHKKLRPLARFHLSGKRGGLNGSTQH